MRAEAGPYLPVSVWRAGPVPTQMTGTDETARMPPGFSDLPTDSVLSVFGFANPTELGGGQQSRVLAVDSDAGRLVVKLSHTDHVNRDLLERRLQMVEDLARLSSLVLSPTRVRGARRYSHLRRGLARGPATIRRRLE